MTTPAAVRLKLDPESVAASGRALAGIAQRMADDVAVLEATVAGPGNPWGGDESGSVFAVAYQGVLGHALQALGSYVQEMGEAALTLTEQARAVAETDALAAGALTTALPAGPVGVAAPAGPAGTNAPAGFAGTVAPAGFAGTVAPAGFAGTVAPAGPAGTVAPAGSGS